MLKKELVNVYIILTFGKTPLLTVWTVSFCLHSSALKDPANKYMFKVSNKITRKWSELCLKLTRKTSEWRRWRSDVFIVNFKHIFAHFSSVSTVEFEQVNVRCNKTTQRNVRLFLYIRLVGISWPNYIAISRFIQASIQNQPFAEVLQNLSVLKNVAKFVWKHLCWSLFVGLRSATIVKRSPNTGGFLWVLRIFFSEHIF